MAGKLCFLVLMNSPRKGAGRPTVLLDMRPLQGPSGGRGVGAYARGLLEALIRADFDSHMTLLLDVAFDEPDLPPGPYRLAGCRRRSHRQLAAYEDAVALTADIQRMAPDMYHAIDFHLPGRSPRPVVVTLHDLIPWAWGGPRMRGERLRYMAAFRLLRRADAVIAVSQATAQDAARLRVAARAQDSDAWGRLVGLYTPLVHYWCHHWGVHGADADDVRQEVFQAVAAGLADFSRAKAGETFRAWLRGITRHKILDFFRSAQQRP